jgi:hypothetical protein
VDADLLEAIRKSQVADALPEDDGVDPDTLYTTPDDTSGDQEPADQQPAHNPNAQSLADYSSQPVAAATRDITPGVAPPESEYAGVAEDQAPKVVQPGAVASPLPEVLQPEYAGISQDQGAAPDIVPQVERGQLVSTPPVPSVSAASAEVTPGVVPPVTEPAPDTLTQVERATPVSLPPPQPVAQASRELALRAALMKLPPVQPVAQATREIGLAPRAQPVVQPAPDTLAQVERGQRIPTLSPYRDPDPDNPDYKTPLSPAEEKQFQAWVRTNKVPFDDSATSDYDMRGFWKAAQEGDPNASTAVSKFDNRIHFPDTYKTPYHRTFSNESQYATSDAPHWVGDRLIDKNGNVVADETPKPAVTGVRGTNVPQGTIAQAPQGQVRTRLNPNDQSLEDYSKPVVAPPTPAAPVTGDLAQGPPGTHPAGTRDEPYWPKTVGQVGQLPPGSVYIDPRDGSVKTTPGKAPAAQQPGGAPITARALPAGAAPPIQPAQPVTTNPNGSDFPQRVQAVGNNDPAAFITHHTSGRGTVDGVISTLKQRGLGVQYVMDREGNIFQTGGPGAQNILTGWGPKGTGLSNQNIVGMEIIAKDDKDVTPQQAQSFARFIAARYPNTPIFGHGEVNPGHKEEDEGQTAKAAALAYRNQQAQGGREQGDQATQAVPVTKGPNGLYANEKPQDFLTGRASVFATDDDIRTGQDNGVGSPKLGRINTNQTAVVAVPEGALQQKFGNNPAAWRKARVDVVDTTTGKRLRLPIGDLGPRGDLSAVIDQSPFVANYFGGDKTLSVKLVPNAGPDITKNPQLWLDEQAAIKQGIDSSSRDMGVQKIQGNLNYTLTSPDAAAHQKLMEADAAQQAQQRQVIAQLPEVQSGNVMGAYNRLNNPIPGVNDAIRLDAQKNLKAEAIKQMQAKFPELRKSDADAWAQAQSPVGAAMAFPAEVGKQIFANYGKLDVAFNQMMQGADSNRMTQFAKILHPDYTPEGLASFVKSLTDIQDPAVRSQTIGKLWAGLDPQIQASFDVNGLVTAADNLSSPAYQKAQSDAIEAKRQYLDKIAAPDPRLKGTTAEWWAQTIGAIPSTVSMAFLPPGIMETAFAAQIYADTKDKLKAAHPDWNDAQLAETTRNSTLAQLLPQEALSAISAGTLGPLVERLTGGRLGLDAVSGAIRSIENPALRAVTAGAPHVAAGAGLGAAQQIAANVAEGRPAMEGVPQAAAGGAVIGAPGALIHGVGAGLHRPEEAVVPEVRPAEPLPITQPLTRAGVLGPDVPDTSVPWYKPPPIVTRGVERGAFSPSELVEAVRQARESGSPEQIRTAIENLRAGTNFDERTVHLAAQPEVSSAASVTQEDVARRAYEIGEERAQSGQPGNALNDWARAQLELSRTSEPILPATVSEAEPITSAIANRYVQERMATGELGQIDPSQGKSTEDMMQQGLQMSRTQRDGLIDNFMKAKGGDLDQQGAAIRSKEALFSEQARAASRAADADPTNPQLQAQAKAAADAVTAFHNGPIKKFKQVWSDSGRALQREIPLDYTTFNGMKEAYLKGNNREAPAELEPKLKQTADAVSKTADAERVALNNFGKEIEKETRGKTLPSGDQVRTRLMEITKHLPCPT